MMALLREMGNTVTMNTVRATAEIMAFNECVANGVGIPERELEPMALRLMEFPEKRLRALQRVVRVLRQSDSLELFTMISRLKSKILAKEVTDDDLFRFFDTNHDTVMDFDDFQNMLNFYAIKLSFDRAVMIFTKASKDKGFVEKQDFPALLSAIKSIAISSAIDAMGFTPLNIAVGLISLGALLGTGMVFILLGIQGFSQGSDLGAATSSILPAGFGKSVQPQQDLSKVKEGGSVALGDSFSAITAN